MTFSKEILGSLKASRVLLIGDLILDEYRWGTALGISAETPTIVAGDDRTTLSLGGAGLLCRNMLELGGTVKFISLVGEDEYSRNAEHFQHPNLTKVFLNERGRKTTVKSRFWVSGYKLLQWDRLDNRPISSETETEILKLLTREIESFDKLIVSDYRHGLITESLAGSLVKLAKVAGKPLYIDSQVSQQRGNHRWYKGADLFCVNKREALTVDSEFDARPLDRSLDALKEILDTRHLIVKLGEKGCAALLGNQRVDSEPPVTRVLDTTGAGDAFFAVVSLAPDELAESHLALANAWAALSTTLKGAQPPTLSLFSATYGDVSLKKELDASLRN